MLISALFLGGCKFDVFCKHVLRDETNFPYKKTNDGSNNDDPLAETKAETL
jgi:hypothetical protein